MLVLRSVRCRNFKSFSEFELSIPSNGTVLVEGPNDAGKPSLIEAVRFGLTGLPSPDRSLESMIRHGESEAAVEVEFEGEFGSCTVERTVLGDGTVRSTLTLNGPDDASVLDDDGAIVDELAHLTGLDADDLSLPCFIESSNARETSKASGGGRESSLIVPKRTDLDRVRVDLSDVDDLEKSAADARDRVRLAKSADRLAGLEKIRGRAERLLKIARVRRAQLNFQAADSEFKSLNAALADWGAARSELNVRIDSAERKMATTNLVDGILKIRDERERLERRIQQTTDLIDEAGHKWSALVHERNKLGKLDRALEQLARARAADGRVAAAVQAQERDEAVFTELENLDLERTMLDEKRELAWAKGASEGRSRAESDPNNSEGAVVLWKAWLTATNFEREGRPSGVRRWRNAVTTRVVPGRGPQSEDPPGLSFSDGEPPEIEIEEIEAALSANGIRVPRDLGQARKLIADSRVTPPRDSRQDSNGGTDGAAASRDSGGRVNSIYLRLTERSTNGSNHCGNGPMPSTSLRCKPLWPRPWESGTRLARLPLTRWPGSTLISISTFLKANSSPPGKGSAISKQRSANSRIWSGSANVWSSRSSKREMMEIAFSRGSKSSIVTPTFPTRLIEKHWSG